MATTHTTTKEASPLTTSKVATVKEPAMAMAATKEHIITLGMATTTNLQLTRKDSHTTNNKSHTRAQATTKVTKVVATTNNHHSTQSHTALLLNRRSKEDTKVAQVATQDPRQHHPMAVQVHLSPSLDRTPWLSRSQPMGAQWCSRPTSTS